MLANAIFALPVLLALLPCSRWIMSFYGPAFSAKGPVLEVLLLSGALLAVQIPVGNLIAAFGRMWVGFFMNAAWAVCFLITARVLVSQGWGAQGLASAYLVAYIAHAAWTFWFASKILRHSPTLSVAGPPGGTTID